MKTVITVGLGGTTIALGSTIVGMDGTTIKTIEKTQIVLFE